ncbi:MAG: ASKHA domain-containing protein [Chitinispirillaceae bacterium]|jgi:uncharacterized 2Fe-2S/4Fe-4S cluster protein (DUF4445 family)
MNCNVIFLPLNKSVVVPSGTLISETAALAGITALHLPCGGRETCGKCMVKIAESNKPESSGRTVLACATRIKGNVKIWIEPKTHEGKSSILATAALEEFWQKGADLSPICKKNIVQTQSPTIEANYSDLELLEAAIPGHLHDSSIRCSRAILGTMAQAMREKNGKVTTTFFSESVVSELIMIEPGDTLSVHYGIACDIGTTTISVRLVDCAAGKILDTDSDYNGQLCRGVDVISRIEYGRSDQRREELRQLVLKTINQLIQSVCNRMSINYRLVTAMSIAGNTTMVHLFLGIPAKHLREHPYVPTVKYVPPLTAAECGLSLNPEAKIIFSPGVGSYVGGDITAGLLCTEMIRSSEELSLFIDIGTNGEIVIGNSEFLMTTACSAGPAFEGSGIQCGMRAAPGAIDSFEIENGGEIIDWTVIGDEKPSGICGSGLISLLGELLKAKIIDRSGKFTDKAVKKNMVTIDGTNGFVLIQGVNTNHGHDIIITESDIDNLIRTKAAIYSACDIMLSNAGLNFSNVKNVLIAGGFGRFIDVADAIRIGLFPNIDTSRFSYLGNTSLAGATLALLYKKYRDELRSLPGRMTYVELSNDPHYMDAYVAALFLPHTDLKKFNINS